MNQKTFPIIGKYLFGWTVILALTFLFVLGLVTGLTDSVRRLSPQWLLPFGIMAVLIGWVLSAANKNQKLCFFSTIFLGPLSIIIVESGVYQNVFRAYFETIKSLTTCPYPCASLPNTGAVLYYLYSALHNLSLYFSELSQWLLNFRLQGGINQLAINLIWGSSLWAVLIVMGWLLRRKYHPFIATLPAFVLLSTVVGYTRQRTSGLIFALTALLSLMVLFEQLKRENEWENQQIDYSEELRFDIISFTVPVIFIIMVIAGLLPRFSFEDIRASLFNRQQQVDTFPRSDLPEAIGLEQTPLDSSTMVSQTGMPRSHLIGSGVELEEIVIMEVDIGAEFLPPQVEPQRQPPTYYWFGSAYEIYIGSGWITDEIRIETIFANQELLLDPPPSYTSSVHRFNKSNAAARTLFYAGVLNTVDQNFILARHELSGEYFTAQLDATDYQVNTYVHNISEEELQQTNQQPPDFILENYLQVPQDLPQRVKELALNITNQEETTYDQARAIEAFLRQYEYSLDLPDPPQDLNIVDYFLFDLQRGYCDYFASAMVVLARVNGLPARLAVGYSTGTYDYGNQVYTVTEANAHAWPEIYIEPYGWIPFEPTASLSVRSWTTENEITPIDLPFAPSEEGLVRPKPDWFEIIGLGILTALILITGFLFYKLYQRRINQPPTTVQIEAIYQKMRGQLASWFLPLEKEYTPREIRLLFSQHLSDIGSHGFRQKLSNLASSNITTIVNLYENGVYSTQTLTPEQIREAKQCLVYTRFQTWLLKTAVLFTKS